MLFYFVFQYLELNPEPHKYLENTLLPLRYIPSPSLLLWEKFVIAHAGLELTLQPSLAVRLRSVLLNFGSSCLSFLISGPIGPSLVSFVYSALKSWFLKMSFWL